MPAHLLFLYINSYGNVMGKKVGLERMATSQVSGESWEKKKKEDPDIELSRKEMCLLSYYCLHYVSC